MKIQALSIFIVVLFSNITNAYDNDISKVLSDDSWDKTFKASLKERYELGPNFNHHDYVFTYSCGGGAICGNIYDSEKQLFIDFPTAFLIDSSSIDFYVSFNEESNQICFSGKGAYENKIFDNQCYKLESGALIELLPNKNPVVNETPI